MITLTDVNKVYGKGERAFHALHLISLEIADGESVAIVGKSGSGKSTLMHVMSGLDQASSGSIVVDGQDIATLKRKSLDHFRAEKIGFIFQSFFVQANETCAQNVGLPLEIARVPRRERHTRIKTALEQVDLADKQNVKAKNLSGGQKQRLAIARAIVTRPSIIFADEPTGNLDSATGARIEKLLFRLNKQAGSTLIIVTHDDDLAQQCDRQITLKDGSIIHDSGATRKRKP